MVRGVLTHVVLLVLALGTSVLVWTREKTPAIGVGEVQIWNVRPVDVERIRFESKGKKVSLEARKDGQGRFFVGLIERSGMEPPDAAAAPPKTVSFVSVEAGNKLTESLAPLRGLREVGRLGDDRLAEFGLKDPEGTLSVTIAGKERKLTLGARAPGGNFRYVRDEGSNTVYVVKDDFTRDLESGDAALSAREPHGWKDADIESARVLARGKSRDVLRRGPDSKRIWADPSDPNKPDETVANWFAKVDRLRPTEYLEKDPPAAELVVRLEYKAKGFEGAFLEMSKVSGPAPPPASSPPTAQKPDFIVRTERTRDWAKVNSLAGEQVEQDLGSILK
jgi:hypothetical protein